MRTKQNICWKFKKGMENAKDVQKKLLKNTVFLSTILLGKEIKEEEEEERQKRGGRSLGHIRDNTVISLFKNVNVLGK